MAFSKGTPKPQNSGRKKGVTNKVNVLAREAFQLAFEGLGGVPNLMKWAQANSTEFYKLYGRLIPVDTTSGGDKIDLSHININIVRPEH